MRRTVLAAAALLLSVGACGGSSDSDPDPSAAPSAESTAAPAPEALSGFSCAAGADGLWSASGTISNTGDAAESFTVDVYVGPADGQERPVSRTELANVQPGGSSPLAVTGLTPQGDPAAAGSAQCHVRVLRALP